MKIERIEASRVKLTFDVTKEEFEIALDKAFEKEKETIKMDINLSKVALNYKINYI